MQPDTMMYSGAGALMEDKPFAKQLYQPELLLDLPLHP